MINDIESHGLAPIRKIRRAKITFQDANEIARQVADLHLTESEAAYRLGIEPTKWFGFKNKGKNLAKYSALFTRLKANAIAQCTSRISKSAEGIDLKQPDWRAAAWRAERLAPERFALNTNQSQTPQLTIQIGIIHEQLKRVFSDIDIKHIEDKRIKMPVRQLPADRG